ncbi:MAG: TAXI family TRAP transporter solute-binding subunit [Bacillota bacterium]|nr:TAXI family TRAP transporter solute-binding subunit [Bacillota bacterium]
MRKRWFAFWTAIVMMLNACSYNQDISRINIGGVDYCDVTQLTVQALSQIWLEMGLASEMRVTRGSVESADLLESGRLISAIISQGVARQYVGRSVSEAPDAPKSNSNIRAGVVLSRRYSQAWTVRNDIQNYLDFENKVICVGPEGGSGKEYLEKILGALGIKPRKYIYADYDKSQEILQSGRADVFFGCLEAPACFVDRDIDVLGARVISLTDTQIDIVLKEQPMFVAHNFPDRAYGEQYKGMRTVGDHYVYCFSKNVPEDIVYNFVKNIFDNKHILQLHSDEYDDFGPEYLNQLILPLHNGAYRYYVEKGIWVPDTAKPIDSLGTK